MVTEKHRDARGMMEGAAAGVAGTVALLAAQGLVQKYLPSAMEPMKLEPGEAVARKVHNQLPAAAWGSIPVPAEKAAGHGLGFGYGITFGALYALLRPRGGSSVLDGVLLGLLCWAVGYLGWLPASGLMPPIWKQKPRQIVNPIANHALYGMTTVCIYDLLREHI